MNIQSEHSQRGSVFLLTLFFTSMFLLLFTAILSFILTSHRAVLQTVAQAQSLYISEAGIQYYRWHLAHDPTHFTEDTGSHPYADPFGETFGQYDLTVTPPASGSTIVTITSNGNTTEYPLTMARTQAQYGKPALSQYAFLTNSNIWLGDSEEVRGQLHSNGGIRNDGQVDSLVTSAKETYICGVEHGCNNQEKDGVWGSGEDPLLWDFPREAIDFDSLLLDLNALETDAQTDGVYLGDSAAHGYFVEFHSNGTMTINQVTELHNPVYGHNGTDWIYESNDKKTWSPVPGYENIALPNNGVLFLADNVWVAGTVHGRVTLVAARLPEGSAPGADMYIQEDITYSAHDGSNTLALMAQEDLLVPLRVDNLLEIDAALVAVNGHVFRYYYPKNTSEPYNTYAIRDKIETYGSLMTNTLWTWSWVSSESGPVISGFKNTETSYDPFLTFSSPPAFPTENEYVILQWKELTLTE